MTVGFEEAKRRLIRQVRATDDPGMIALWVQQWGPALEWNGTDFTVVDGVAVAPEWDDVE